MSIRVVSFIAVTITSLCACIAEHGLGFDPDPTPGYCCFDEELRAKVPACGTGRCTCEPSLCAGGNPCLFAEECPSSRLPCLACTDGTSACPEVACESSRCVTRVPLCPPQRCTDAAECPPPGPMVCERCADGACAEVLPLCNDQRCGFERKACDVPATCAPPPQGTCAAPPGACVTCGDGTQRCAQASCVGDACKVSFPSCPLGVECTPTSSSCPVSTISCAFCPGTGEEACPRTFCDGGYCRTVPAICPVVAGGPSGCDPFVPGDRLECHGFENSPDLSGAYTVNGSLSKDGGQVFRGSFAGLIQANQTSAVAIKAAQLRSAALPASPTHTVRGFFYLDGVPIGGGTSLLSFVQPDPPYHLIGASTTADGHLMLDVYTATDPGGHRVSIAPLLLPVRSWFCLELRVTWGAGPAGKALVLVNDVAIDDITYVGNTVDSPRLDVATWGPYIVEAPVGPYRAWMDELVVGTQPLGCTR